MKASKDRFPKWKGPDRLKALELILKYKEQLPPQEINASVEMKTVNVNIAAPSGFDITDI
jgi:hypothetical protein